MISILILLIFTIICLIVSFILNKEKTIRALKIGLKMFLNLLPPFLSILILVSVLLYFTPKEILTKLFGKEEWSFIGAFFAAIIGSISLIPGFIAYPLGKILIQNGVSYSIIAIFITTLMMVGIITLPIEKKFFGLKVAIIRNSFSFVGAIIVGLLIGILWGIIK
ncbi:MAG TPA: hypothetical protein PLE45_02045 [Spirochaetota bacterium]|nr:hypothetical protein [Spirochaetota bacterium]HOL57028.1 hypothetical protein [Spirochaetota bacterium]HPP04607.1 hypothetical protein [Spirochaetota bacterium]